MIRRMALFLGALALVVLALAAGALAWLRGRGRPLREGSVRLPALSAPVDVRWDAFGVPHLRGASGADLAAALGYLHANDRLAQMELGRRAMAGRLSELLGERTLEADRWARIMRYREAAEASWESAGPESRAWLEAYAVGVNAWLGERRGDLPPTLTLLRARPEPWTPVDSLGFVLLMSRDLSFWQGRPEELRLRWLASLGFERTRDLIGDPELHLPPGLEELAASIPAPRAAPAGAQEEAPGSNNWALGSSRSAAAGPVVASDPHLSLRLPGVWYQAHFRAPGFEAAGMTLPGLPGVVIGRGPDVAWALTNLMLDDHDLFLEELDPEGRRVRRGEEWRPVRTETETILVRGGEAVRLELQSTEIGPLLPADRETGLPPRSLAWTAHLPGDPLRAFLRLAQARTVEEIPEGVAGYVGPAQNLVAADSRGGLLYLALGRLPARRLGDGRLPVPAWAPGYGWDGLHPADLNPRLLPPQDLLVTANHDTRPYGYGGPLSADFDLPARARRIRARLEERATWAPGELAAVQTDVESLYARDLVRLAAGSYRGDAGRAYEALAAWDGRMEVRGPAALFSLFERRLGEAIFADELDFEATHGMSRRLWLLRILSGEMSPRWFDDARTGEPESREEILERSLAAAWREGVRRWGPDPAAWSYGELHTLTLRHPLGILPLLGRLVDRGPFPIAGSATTVAAFGGPWRRDDRPVTYGPSMRWIAAPGDDRILAVLPGGQAGHPFDPHYDDQLPLYLAGELRAVAWSEEAIAAATVGVLGLEP